MLETLVNRRNSETPVTTTQLRGVTKVLELRDKIFKKK